MNKFLLTTIASLIIVGGTLFYLSDPGKSTSTNFPTVKETPRRQIPERLIIPKLSIDTAIEQVGLDSQKAMDVPKNVNNVGWYNLGYRPGEIGNAVIAGHFDDRNGSPAVFYNISKLEVGDEIIIKSNTQQAKFQVAMIQTYKWDDFPIDQVFGDFPIARLNLVTCSGSWDQAKKLYLERTVVYTRLVD